MIQAISEFVDFCYLVRRDVLDEAALDEVDDSLDDYLQDCEIFKTEGVQSNNPSGFSLPRQRIIFHYCHLIKDFGAPKGLYSSITESKHIKAVKEP